ncbi:efflux RND transporter periplasmic adaptor subunit [Dokdonella sp.]|uniref:efflux RND transporter periplasmic adaptor subunit n=1 Tax=Dokdonella sp. TaxID=2291710 RepID=UPI0025C5379D|nr:efflux RND transporter periplasmic adaptor subunit [Dokdonella sp.]MBX3690762.1 efflux RND transporter periplasmic adaptor subunit [Dokdonella sp.]MCW5568527.1 efflux RND transporter periplasmic adaptor subunit [Dokdonella sp.]
MPRTPVPLHTVAALLAALLATGCASQAEAPQPRLARVAHPTASADATVAVFPGEVRARYESTLGFRVPGKISTRKVDTGSHVHKGDLLAELDPRDLELSVASARAALVSAEANLKLADSEHERYVALYAKRFVSQFERDAKANALEAARAVAAEARAQLDTARNQAGYTSLRADADGVITAVAAELGQVVAAGQPVFTLAHDGAIEVEIHIPENQVALNAPGRDALVELWAEAGRRAPARIREVAPGADAVTRTYRVRVAFADDSLAPRLGQTARVYFGDTGGAERWRLPLSALHEKDGKPALWRLDPATRQVHLVDVGVLRYEDDGVLIDRGIDAQAWIVTAGVHRLREGEAVVPIDADNRPITF